MTMLCACLLVGGLNFNVTKACVMELHRVFVSNYRFFYSVKIASSNRFRSMNRFLMRGPIAACLVHSDEGRGGKVGVNICRL